MMGLSNYPERIGTIMCTADDRRRVLLTGAWTKKGPGPLLRRPCRSLWLYDCCVLRYSALTRSSNRMSTPNTPTMLLSSLAMGADTVIQSAPVILEV